MHFPFDWYYPQTQDFREIAIGLVVLAVIVAVGIALKTLQHSFEGKAFDPARLERARLNRRFAAGLLSFEQYVREKKNVP